MELVINIPEDLYVGIVNRDGSLETEYVCCELMRAVDSGTLLPKGHGRLIDIDAMYDDFEHNDYDLEETLEYAPEIIPKEGEI